MSRQVVQPFIILDDLIASQLETPLTDMPNLNFILLIILWNYSYHLSNPILLKKPCKYNTQQTYNLYILLTSDDT